MISPQTPAIASTTWDAWAALSVGMFMKRITSLSPPPDDSQFAADLERWSGQLIAHGQGAMTEAGERHLSAVTA